MKAVSTQAHITSIRSRRDKSLGFSVETPELTSDEKVAFMNLQGVNLKMLIEPEEGGEEVVDVQKDIESKTQSQRIRSIIYILWKQDGEPGEFPDYYHAKTEKYIEFLKEKIQD